MFSAAERTHVRRVVVHYLNVRNQAGASIGAFDHVVTKNGVTRKTMLEDLLECRYFVDALAGKASFSKKILVHIRDRSGVHIEPGIRRENRGHTRAVGGLDADVHARLQNTVAFHDRVAGRIDDRTVQGMRNRSHHLVASFARQLGV